jgi:hypothetical protein
MEEEGLLYPTDEKGKSFEGGEAGCIKESRCCVSPGRGGRKGSIG